MTNKEESVGYIYILTNPSFPEYVKIGYAKNVNQRLKQLNRSASVPYAFRAYAVYEVTHKLTDKKLHMLIDTLDPDLRTIETFDGKKRTKEFYEMIKEKAYLILQAIAEISGTEDRLHLVNPTATEIQDEEKAKEAKKESKRAPFRFSLVNIKPGEKVVYIDDPSITPEVVDDRHIEWKGKTTSLSALAQELRSLKGINSPVQGLACFSYNGEIFDDLRTRLEEESRGYVRK
jgi:hypothetical protein